jgi:hypothetical protein
LYVRTLAAKLLERSGIAKPGIVVAGIGGAGSLEAVPIPDTISTDFGVGDMGKTCDDLGGETGKGAYTKAIRSCPYREEAPVEVL